MIVDGAKEVKGSYRNNAGMTTKCTRSVRKMPRSMVGGNNGQHKKYKALVGSKYLGPIRLSDSHWQDRRSIG